MTAPQNQLHIQGVTVASADYLNTLVQWCPSVAVLRTFIGLNGSSVFLLGYSTPNDGGQGMFLWNPSLTNPDDGVNIIRPPAMITGGWQRSGNAVFSGYPPVFLAPGSTTPAACQSSYVAQGAATLQLQATTTAGGACTIFAFAYGGPLTLSLLSALDNINGGAAGAGITIPQGYSSAITNDGAGHYFATMAPAAGGPATIFLSGGATVASPFVTYVALAASTLQLPPSSTLNANWSVNLFAYGGAVTVTPLSASDVINGQAAGTSFNCPTGYYLKIVSNAAGHFYVSAEPATIVVSSPSAAASCLMYKTGNQSLTTNAYGKVVFDATGSNIGGFFNTTNNRWTPPAGRTLIAATVHLSALFAVGFVEPNYLNIYKNGAGFLEGIFPFTTPNGTGPWDMTMHLSLVDVCTGSDYYEIFVNSPGSSVQVMRNAILAGYGTFFTASSI